MKKISIFTVLFVLIANISSCKKGEVIEEIGSSKVTTGEYEEYYATYLEKASRYANAEKSTLYKLMCNPDQIPPNPILQDLVEKLKPENNYEEFRQMRIIEQVAKQEGFTNRPIIKKIIEQTVTETIVHLYLQEKLDERIKITPEEKKAKCEELRVQYPGRMNGLPLDTCMYIAEGVIKRDIIYREERKLRDEIKEEISVKKNQSFNKENYFSNKMEIYNSARKEGGCEAVPSAPKKDKK